MPQILQIALNTPVGDFFDYLCHHNTPPQIGVRVKVLFGKRELIGIVVGISDNSDVPMEKLKAIGDILDDTPIVSYQTLTLAKWLSSYYHYPLGETLAVMLPTLIKQGKSLLKTQHYALINNDDEFINSQLKRSKVLKAQFDKLTHFLKETHKTSISETDLTQLDIKKSQIGSLIEKGLLKKCDDIHLPNIAKAPKLKDTPLILTDEQLSAHTQIIKAMDNNVYQGFLLNGVTGSGKTENYLHAIWHCLQQGKQALILVPEIGLTPQTYQRFAQRFDAKILILHSNLNDTERLSGWQACKDGTAQIIIATRSALLYDFARLGLIIVDECHDSSYKQGDHLRYSACDVALYVGFLQKIPVILGTATPSLEQIFLVKNQKLTELSLTARTNSTPPRFELIDKRLYPHLHPISQKPTAFTSQSIHAISEHLGRGEQVLVFLNRRGYAPVMLCESCGWQADCVRCDAHLTYHKAKSLLICHHCSHQMRVPSLCPACHSTNLTTLGAGTAQLFEELHAIFANPQTSVQTYPIVQIDRDTTSKKHDWERLYTIINTGEPMILVGTQMLAKGHHFDKVTLVVVVDADAGFLSADFRSPEHTAQTIVQVAGRAGRADLAGRVLIQTVKPDNPLLLELIKDGYLPFARSLLKERELLALPPYSYAVLIESKSPNQGLARQAIITIKDNLPKSHPFAVLAPIEPPINKKNNQFFYQMLILSKNRKELHLFLDEFLPKIKTLNDIRKVRLTVDIDPAGW